MSGQARAYLVATDGSPASDKAIEQSIIHAKQADVPLIVVMAVEGDLRASQGGRRGVQLDSELRTEAQAKVDEAVRKAASAGVEATGEVVSYQPPETVAETIARLAGNRRVTHVFVGSHGRTGLMSQMLGSTADQIVKLTHCHVTVVR